MHALQRAARSSPRNVRLLSTSAAAAAVARRAGSSSRQVLAQGARMSSTYAARMREAWSADPASVHPAWRKHFEKGGALPSTVDNLSSESDLEDALKVDRLVRAYQVRGHNISQLDPLGIMDADLDGAVPPELNIENYGWSMPRDFDRIVPVGPTPLFNPTAPSNVKLGVLLKELQRVYCTSVGAEYIYISDSKQVEWLRSRLEVPYKPLSTEQRKSVLNGLIRAEGFEKFLQKKFSTEKRFGLDGGEALIPGMQTMIRRSAEQGVELIVFGMAHRGRLNVLHNVMGKPLAAILKEFQHLVDQDNEDDVKYHLGMSTDVEFPDIKKSVHLSLLANPSHLEAVNPVVEGKVRAEQDLKGDHERKRVMPVVIHGDAAFSGQGIVFETIGLAYLPAYTTGGTIHIVINNQIGFTTDPRSSRSSPYCTDIAKIVGAPILHVNGDDPEAVHRCFQLATDWRQTFGRDVVVDVVCYRRYGHNESDQAMFTQPRMCQTIEAHRPVLALYSESLLKENVLTPDELEAERKKYDEYCQQQSDAAPTYRPPAPVYLGSHWRSYKAKVHGAPIRDTGVPLDVLQETGLKINTVPKEANANHKLVKVYDARLQSIKTGTGLDWATCEALAFATLLREGFPVRVAGQDVERGTFSHRHAVLHDQASPALYRPLEHVAPKQAPFTICNSHLSEYAALGFEFGYSMTNPDQLVCWEAQFGDFANTAQVMIDQFISSSHSKWKRQNGLVMLLPHGYEGMGPEHSSARLERFLQMCDDDESVYPVMDHVARKQIEEGNWQVVNATTPANLFHILRRQVYRDFRRPLIMMTPKSLLRHPLVKSNLADMQLGTRFLRFIPETDPTIFTDPKPNPSVRRLVLCSGKVYYDLLEKRQKSKITDVAIGRIEQISPFPYDLVHRHADNFPNAEIMWCQEEPRNMGAWTYVAPRIETALSKSIHHANASVKYAGRRLSGSTATGDKYMHGDEQAALVGRAFA
eukprot:m.168912 g.168912  ORF g.168912 m.168912 type:complete len:978 (-) comp17227_c0_seq1:240-3173(-)